MASVPGNGNSVLTSTKKMSLTGRMMRNGQTSGQAPLQAEVKLSFLPITYSKDSFVRFFPVFSVRDLDDAMFLPFVNKSLAEKVKAIHVFANGYKLQEIESSDINIDATDINPSFPTQFDDDELKDQWVRIRPKGSSTFHMRFLSIRQRGCLPQVR